MTRRGIALIDCTYDWTAKTVTACPPGYRKESNRRCGVVVVIIDGRVLARESLPVTDTGALAA